MQKARTHYLGEVKAFTLPTVVIASLTMLSLLLGAFQISGAISNNLRSQYHQQLAYSAATAETVMVNDCMASGISTWSNPLRPSSSCAGMSTQCTGSDACWVVNTISLRSTFSVATPTPSTASSEIQSVGTVELLNQSTGAVVATITQNVKMTIQ